MMSRLRVESISRVLGVDLLWFFKNSTWVTIGRVSKMVSDFGVVVLFARFVNAELFGQYKWLISVITIISIFALPGFNGSMFRAIARGYDGTFRAVILLSRKYVLIGSVILICFGSYMFFVGQIVSGSSFFIASVVFPFAYIANRWGILLDAKELFDVGARYNILLSFGLLVGMGGAILCFGDSVPLLVGSFLVVNSVLHIFIYLRSLRYVENDRVERNWKSSGYILACSHAFQIFYSNIDKIVLGYVLGVYEVAIYVIAISVGGAVKSVLMNSVVIYKPKIFKGSEDDIRRIMRHYIFLAGLLASGFVVALWFILPFLILRIFTDAYAESILYSQVYMLILPFSLVSTILGELLIKMKRESLFLFSNMTSSILTLLLYFVLIPSLGIMGAIVASILFFAVQSVLRYAMVLDGLPSVDDIRGLNNV